MAYVVGYADAELLKILEIAGYEVTHLYSQELLIATDEARIAVTLDCEIVDLLDGKAIWEAENILDLIKAGIVDYTGPAKE